MALNVGELVAFMSLDDKEFTTGIDKAMEGLDAKNWAKAADQAGGAASDGLVLDPAGFEADSEQAADALSPSDFGAAADQAAGAASSALVLDDTQYAADAAAAADEVDAVQFRTAAGQAGDAASEALILDDSKFAADAEAAADEIAPSTFRATASQASAAASSALGLDDSKFASDAANALGNLSKGEWNAAGLAAGTAAAAGIGVGFAGAVNVEAGRNKVSAQLNLTAAESERIGGLAGGLFADGYGESLDSVNSAFVSVIGGVEGMRDASDAELEAATGAVLDFADTFEQDVSRATQVAGQMITTGFAPDVETAMDMLTSAMQQVPAAVRDDLVDAVDEYGPFFQQVGIDGETAMAALVSASDRGMYGIDKAGDAVKEFGIRVSDLDDTAAQEALGELGISGDAAATALTKGGDAAETMSGQIFTALSNIEDPAEQARLSMALFGTPLEDLGKDGIPEFIDSLATGQGSLGEFEGAAGEAGEKLRSGFGSELEQLKRAGSQAFSGLAASALPVLQPLLGILQRFAPVIAPIIIALGGFALAVAGINGAMRAWTAVTTAHRAVMMVLTGTTTANTVATGANTGAQNAGILTRMRATAVLAGQRVAMVASTIATNAATVAQRALNMAMRMNPIGIIITLIAALVAGLIWFFTQTDTGRAIWQGFMDWLGNAWQWLKDTAVSIFDGIVDTITGAWQWVKDKTAEIWDSVTSWISDNWDTITGILSLANPVTAVIRHWDTIKNATATAWNWVVNKLSGIWNSITSIISNAANRVVSWISNAWNNAKTTTSNAFSNIRNAVSNGINNVVSFVRGLPGRILSALGNLGSMLFSSGWNMIDGLRRGIVDAFNNAVSAVRNGMSRIRNFFPFSPAKEGPFAGSGYTDVSGRALVSDFAAGMQAAEADVVRQAEAITKAAAFSMPDVGVGGVSANAGARGAEQSGGVTNNFTVINPQAEPTSETARKASAYIGVGGSI